ncbi:S1C family serine protease [Haloferula helveola]
MPEVKAGRPFIGVVLDPVPELLANHLKLEDGQGLVIADIVAGGPAAKGGLQVDDLLVEVGGAAVGSPDDVRRAVGKHQVGDEVEVTVIHEGDRKKVSLTLAEAPAEMPAPAPEEGVAGADALDGFLENLPEQHADKIREALEKNLRQFEMLDLGQVDPGNAAGNQVQEELMKRLRQQMRGGGNGMQMKFDFNAESSVRLMDDKGSVEMKSVDGHKEVKAYDKEGKLLWEGPYDTEQDKAAVPDDIRERIERLNVDMNFEGRGLKLRVGPDRFRPLDQLEEDLPAPAEEDAPKGDE